MFAHLLAHANEPSPRPEAIRNQTGKFALVIGNSNYQGFNRNLKNPSHDAELMSSTLTQLGFDVRMHLDLSRSEMSQHITEFATSLPAGATSLTFYAGHGVQIGGASYLMPVDIQLSSEQNVQLRAFPLRRLLDDVSASAASVNIVVLDACRDNPFQPPPPVRYRSAGPMGLAKVQAPRGTFLAYSTQPGQLAADGTGINSVYTDALAKTLLEPGLRLEDIFKKVNTLVRNKTRDDQIPWYESSVTESYFFLPPDDITVIGGARTKNNTARNIEKKRSISIPPQPPLWFMHMSDYEWSKLDREIEQRAKRLDSEQLAEQLQLAESGNVVAMTTVGLAFSEDVRSVNTRTGGFLPINPHIKPNLQTALEWTQKAAQQGFPIAQTLLAEMYIVGQGVRRNPAEANRLLALAAKSKYPRAKIGLVQSAPMQHKAFDPKLVDDAFKSIIRSMQPPP